QDSATLQPGGVVLTNRVTADQGGPGVKDGARAHAPCAPPCRVLIGRPKADGPNDARDLDMAEVSFITQGGGEVRHILDGGAPSIGGDVGERLLDADRPEQVVGQRDRCPYGRPAEVGQPAWSGEVDRVWERVAIHEHGVLLADPEIAEIDKRASQ